MVEDLVPNTVYAIYITCGSSYPGYPDLLPDEQVVVLNKETDPTEIPPGLVIDSAADLEWTILLFSILINF